MDNKEMKLYNLLKQDEFYLSDLFKIFFSALKKSKKIMLIVFICIIVLFTFDYTLSPIEFESKATVMVEQQTSTNNASLISLLGLSNNTNNLSSNSSILGPEMYTELFKSQVFLNEIIQSKIPISQESKDSITLEEFFSNGEILSFYQKIKNPKKLFNNTNPYTFNQKTKVQSTSTTNNLEDSIIVKKNINPELIFSNQIPPIVQIDNKKAAVIAIMKKRIRLEIKDKNVTVYTKMPNPFQSAVVGKAVLENLLRYITAFKTHKQLSQIEFLEKRVNDSEERYKKAQQNFAGYKDNTLGIILQSAQTREQILNNELTVAFNIYNQFSVQLEQAKVDLKKETPYFSILEPISIPGSQLEPSLSTFLIKYLVFFIGLIFLIVLYKLLF
jgi:uncharacterized protein involved in exopolysaccharide biosynthesis